MNKIILIAFSFTVFLGCQFLSTKKSEAGMNDPWYACYVVSGGSLQKCMGPYDNKFACAAARYSLPYGAKWIGCKQ